MAPTLQQKHERESTSAAKDGKAVAADRKVSASRESTQQIWTVLISSWPYHLGLWLKAKRRSQSDEGSEKLREAAAVKRTSTPRFAVNNACLCFLTDLCPPMAIAPSVVRCAQKFMCRRTLCHVLLHMNFCSQGRPTDSSNDDDR